MNEQLVRTAQGGILYDPLLLSKHGIARAEETWFEPAHWLENRLAIRAAAGRGNVLFIYDDRVAPPLAWVLRHYRRGGLVAKLSRDGYVWCGADHTRAFREWRLLSYLRARYLPVPIPVAARYVRHGLSYRADLITQQIGGARTLTQRLGHAQLPADLWQRVGATLARFHVLGVRHADLNAHNIVFDAQDEVHVLDFDRGRIVAVNLWWIKRVLARLLRSLLKLREQQRIRFDDAEWQSLLRAHDAEFARLRKQYQ